MKNRLKFLVISTIYLLSAFKTYAQSDAQKAQIRVHITNANSALQSSNWDQAISNVSKAQDVLGSSAAIFESIKIKAYHGKKEYQKAKEHLLLFFQLSPSDDLIDEIAPFSADIDNKLEAVIAEREKEDREKRKKEDFINNIDHSSITFRNGLASVNFNGNYGYIDKNNNVVIPFKYDNVYPFSEGLAAVKLNGKWGYIDTNGNEVIPLKYDYAYSFFEGLAPVRYGKFGYIDKNGNVVVSFKYAVDSYPNYFSEGLVAVALTGQRGIRKWGYVDRTGKEVIPFKYDYATDFSEGLARVSLNGKWGYLDKSGKEITLIKYDETTDFSDGFARVSLHGESFTINKNGKRVD